MPLVQPGEMSAPVRELAEIIANAIVDRLDEASPYEEGSAARLGAEAHPADDTGTVVRVTFFPQGFARQYGHPRFVVQVLAEDDDDRAVPA